MRILIPTVILLTLVSIFPKVPFKTLYIEIRKERYEGDPEFLNNHKKNIDKLDLFVSNQKIWVDVENNSYLMIEEPAEGNNIIEKNGKLKFEGRDYTLDYGLNFAWDGTGVEGEKIFDNYTTAVPNYEFYPAKLVKKVKITTGDRIKRKAHIYAYKFYDPTDQDETNAYVNEIKNSDMPEEDKNVEIQAALGALEKKAIKYTEWIWVDMDAETQMFLRKYETTVDVKTIYEITKLDVNVPLEKDVFEDTLSKFKVKKVKG
ncbi:MAG: hypothetical protein PF574_00395 [Candidatus Delongbacteria bacterium]|jgi:hypothetical protein|nr:hypothetical protein [Candidatus Delongbacteria bacterium]